MNLKKSFWLLFATVIMLSTACDNGTDTGPSPELPPLSTMVMDFDNFTKSSTIPATDKINAKSTTTNWFYSSIVVGVWNAGLVTTLGIPVAAFRTALVQRPEHLGGQKWQWSYVVDGFTSEYSARLTGEIVGNEVHWEMYIEKSGVGAFDEFLWFSGESQTNGKSGFWLLNHSAEFPENLVRIDWTIENAKIASIKYTYVRELNSERNIDLFKDSYIIYGVQASEFDAFYDVHAYDFNKGDFADIDIEWSTTNFSGQVMAPDFFGDNAWHCWDSDGEDILCQ